MSAPAQEGDPELLSATEVAALTGVSYTTVCRWAREGRIVPLRKFGGQTAAYVFGRDVLDVIDGLIPPSVGVSTPPPAEGAAP